MVKHRLNTWWPDDREVGFVCGLHRAQEDEECKFLNLASKPRSSVSQVGPQNW
jgi:hypothetical protein